MANHDGRQQTPPQFERHLMSAYLAGAGYDFETLLVRNDDQARQPVARALEYVSKTCIRECYLAGAAPLRTCMNEPASR